MRRVDSFAVHAFNRRMRFDVHAMVGRVDGRAVHPTPPNAMRRSITAGAERC